MLALNNHQTGARSCTGHFSKRLTFKARDGNVQSNQSQPTLIAASRSGTETIRGRTENNQMNKPDKDNKLNFKLTPSEQKLSSIEQRNNSKNLTRITIWVHANKKPALYQSQLISRIIVKKLGQSWARSCHWFGRILATKSNFPSPMGFTT